MRIIYLWDADYPWDVRTEKVCLALTEAGHDVHIVARNRAWRPAVESLKEGTVHRIPPWRWAGRALDDALGFPAFFNPRWRHLLAKTAKEIGADVIVARDHPLCPTAIHIGAQLGIPVVFDMAEHYPALMRALWETGRQRPLDYLVRNPKAVDAVERYCIRNVSEIVVVVEESAERIERLGADPERITVVSNTPPASRLRTKQHTPVDGRPLDIVYLGNLEVIRGILESIDAVAILRANGHQVRLRVIGSGRDADLARQRTQSHGLGSDAVEFLGYIPSHADALDVVASADVGLIPHRRCALWDNTIPNKLFDYMAAGLPVITSDAAPAARIVRETASGLVYESSNPDALAAVIEPLFETAARKTYGDAGQKAVREQYNWETDAALFLTVVESAARRSRGTAR